jgi:hypothetical protein
LTPGLKSLKFEDKELKSTDSKQEALIRSLRIENQRLRHAPALAQVEISHLERRSSK